MAEIYVPGAIDIMGSANQMMQFRNSQQAQQANALQMQYAAEDRAREAENRKIAAGNALAARARAQKIAGVYEQGFNPGQTALMTPGIAPGPGVVRKAVEPSYDYTKTALQFLKMGETGKAEELFKLPEARREASAKGMEGDAKAQLAVLETSAKAYATALANVKPVLDQAISIDGLLHYVDVVDADPVLGPLAIKTGGPTEARKEAIRKMAAPKEAGGGGMTVDQIAKRLSGVSGYDLAGLDIDAKKKEADLASTQATTAKTVAETKATDEKRTAPLPTEIDIGGEKIFVDMNPNSPTFKQKLTNFVKTLTPNEVATNTAAAAKADWEQKNPGFTIEDTASGKVKVNKITGVVEPLTLDGQTLMPSVKPGVTVNTGEKGIENTIKKGGEITLANYQALKNAPRSIASLETVKKLILMPGTKDMLGGGASVLVDVANTLNNRLGTNINVKGLTNAVEIRSRLFEGVVARLKQMDSQPSERQQAALAEALGNIDTDPDALARVVDVWIEEMKDKIKTHNALITKQVKSGDTAIGDYTIDLQETAAAPTVINWK